jgi:Saccharopine dehydrogenase NADP binding domain
MTQPAIGIVGATGAVGAAAARYASEWCGAGLRLGGRRVDRVRPLADDLEADAFAVDYDDAAALRAFCDGCAIVINCAGPSHRVADRVAAAAFAAHAHYVDPGGDEPLQAALAQAGQPRGDLRALLSAGMMPGLTAMIPRWVARLEFDRVDALTAYVRLRNRFTHAAAVDYLLSEQRGYGESLAAWLRGSRRTRALEPLTQVQLPYFSALVNAYPYLSREADRLAATLRLSELRWYHLFDDHRIVSLVGQLQHAIAQGQDVESAADSLVRAVDLELFGREPSIEMVFEIAGDREGRAIQRTATYRAADTYEASGAVAALAADAILAGGISPGLHFAADVIDAASVIDRIRRAPKIGVVTLVQADASADVTDDEGVV